MASQRAKRIVAFWLSVLGHALIVVALTFSVSLQSPERPVGVIIPIQTVMVDEAAIDARAAEIEAARQAEIERQQRVERDRQEQIEQQRRELEAAERAKIQLEAERRAEEERLAQLEEERIQREAEEARQREAERQAQLEREREEAERRRREEELARQQQAAAAEIAAALAAEREAEAARNSGALEQWMAAISNKVQARWIEPPNVPADLECLVAVTQLPTGEVTAVSVRTCSTNAENIIRSVENAVHSASPLPRPSVQSLYQRNIVIRFTPAPGN
jgi:colicin import membrane protein